MRESVALVFMMSMPSGQWPDFPPSQRPGDRTAAGGRVEERKLQIVAAIGRVRAVVQAALIGEGSALGETRCELKVEG
jgi:hypothetical protein